MSVGTVIRPSISQALRQRSSPALMLMLLVLNATRRSRSRPRCHTPPSSVPRLLCPDCKHHRPDPLTTAVVGLQTAQVLAGARATTVEASAAWLLAGSPRLRRAAPRGRPPPLLAARSRRLRTVPAPCQPARRRRPARQAQTAPDDPRQAPGPYARTATPAAAGQCGTGLSRSRGLHALALNHGAHVSGGRRGPSLITVAPPHRPWS